MSTVETTPTVRPSTVRHCLHVIASSSARPSARPSARTAAQATVAQLWDRLVAVLPWLDQEGRIARLAVISAGFMPVTLIAASTFGIVGLKPLALAVLAPTVVMVAALAVLRPGLARLIGRALIAGAIATAVYDVVRFGFIGLNLVGHDPIPHIGVALGLHPAWVFGYMWRYLGNGGGLAIAFFGLGFRGVRKGILFGLFVCAGLIVTLIVSPHATEVLFPLTVPSVIMMTLGHAVYGGVLGAITARRAAAPMASVSPMGAVVEGPESLAA
jgi:uncharacterized membrane protein